MAIEWNKTAAVALCKALQAIFDANPNFIVPQEFIDYQTTLIEETEVQE